MNNAWNNEVTWQHKKLVGKTKTGKNVPSLEVVEVVLAQCNLVDNRYKQKSAVLNPFTRSKCYDYFSNVQKLKRGVWLN